MINAIFVMTALLAVASILMLVREARLRAMDARVRKAVNGLPGQSSSLANITEWLAQLGTRYRRFYSPENLGQMRTVVQSAGYNPHTVMPILIGGKAVSMLMFPTVTALFMYFSDWSLMGRLGAIMIGLAIGVMAPRGILALIGRRYNAAVRRGTPDALDLLVVCSEAGMGLESALERVAQEMSRTNLPMATVLEGLLDDLRVLPNRQDAFTNLAARSTYDGLRRFGIMISQSLQYGTPISNALRAIANELRRERLTKLEERATKLAAKLIIPMVLFMLPAMGIVLMGSSFLHLIDTFKNMGH